MIKNYIKIAFRSLWRQKGYSAINVFGLSVALCVSLLMLLWVQDEWSTDQFHLEKERLFRVHRAVPLEGERMQTNTGVPYPLLAAAVEEIPEVMRYIPYRSSSAETIIYGNTDYRAKGTFGNAAFFESFTFPILQGDPNHLDENPNSIAISQGLAKRLFGNTWKSNTIGKTIKLHDIGEFSIELIYSDFPDNCTLDHDFVYSFEHFLSEHDGLKHWGNSRMRGVVLLQENSDAAAVAQKMDRLFKSHQETEMKEGCNLQPYTEHYLYNHFDDQAKAIGGRIEYVRTFAIAAFLLLLISCINFVNLATALASRRAKEVGVRKVVGALKKSLITQFLTESAVVTLLAMTLAVILGKFLEPVVWQLTGKELSIALDDPAIWISLLVIGAITTVLSGAYPSFVLSNFRPASALKGRIASMGSHVSLRKLLVILQFVFALLLIAGALIIREQIHYIMDKNLGLAKENIIEIPRDENIATNYQALRNELIRSPAILDVTSAGPSPLEMHASTSGVSWAGKRPDQENQEFQIVWAENNFTDLFEVPMAAGEFYRTDQLLDSSNIVLNEKAVEVMGLEGPVGKTITWWGQERRIIGVVQDFHNQSLYSEIAPTGILQDREGAWSIYVKSASGEISAAIDHLEASFAQVLPEVPLRYQFLDDQYAQTYKAEILTGKLSNYFAIIAIIISILGLLGLATYMAQQRRKEIGVRKVLGATVTDLMVLLSKDFLILVGIGSAVGLPITWYLLQNWLTKFEFKINLEWWMFVIPMAGAMLIAGITVGLQSLRAAWQNPVNAIQNNE